MKKLCFGSCLFWPFGGFARSRLVYILVYFTTRKQTREVDQTKQMVSVASRLCTGNSLSVGIRLII